MCFVCCDGLASVKLHTPHYVFFIFSFANTCAIILCGFPALFGSVFPPFLFSFFPPLSFICACCGAKDDGDKLELSGKREHCWTLGSSGVSICPALVHMPCFLFALSVPSRRLISQTAAFVSYQASLPYLWTRLIASRPRRAQHAGSVVISKNGLCCLTWLGSPCYVTYHRLDSPIA